MDIFFQWLQKNTSIIAIAISLVSLTLSVVGFVLPSTDTKTPDTKKQKRWYRLKKLWSLRYSAFHLIVSFFLTGYVTLNWDKCISMQFFSEFSGNNILFLVWIADILLYFYDVEIKEGKLHKRNIEEAKKQVQDKDIELKIGQRFEAIDKAISEMHTGTNGGGKKQ